MTETFKRAETKSSASAGHTRRPFVLASLVIAMFMAAIEGTIVATAMPNIVADLGGFSLYSWVFSAFLLMQAVTTLIYGKLSDLFGRKPVFLFGVLIFLIGSILCGFAESMTMLIVFRLLQGIGAGAVQPIATTIVGDLYEVRERAKIQGYLASVWGISAILGPLAGGLIVQYSDWAYVFWLNVPLGVLGLIGVLIFFRESVEKEARSIDYVGSALCFIVVSSLMIVFIKSGSDWGLASLPTVMLLFIFVISFGLFLAWEKKFPAPMMPLFLWKHRLVALANIATLTSGMILIGLSSFLPAYVQGVMGYSAITAGFTLTMLSVGWPVASTFAGPIFLKIGYRNTAVAGGIALLIGSLFFVFLDPENSPVWPGIGSFFTGVGMGLTSTTFIVAVQNSVNWKTRGVATASNMFMRMLGSSMGAALLGGLLNARLRSYLQAHGKQIDENISIDTANVLLSGSRNDPFSEQTLQLLENGLTVGLHAVYIGVFVIAAGTFIVTLLLPKLETQSK
ncbi:MAG TPA: MDR family MFS transporter [Bacillales bacterium]|nr:MDR family MFS transporter [Bacillales bacterium]